MICGLWVSYFATVYWSYTTRITWQLSGLLLLHETLPEELNWGSQSTEVMNSTPILNTLPCVAGSVCRRGGCVHVHIYWESYRTRPSSTATVNKHRPVSPNPESSIISWGIGHALKDALVLVFYSYFWGMGVSLCISPQKVYGTGALEGLAVIVPLSQPQSTSPPPPPPPPCTPARAVWPDTAPPPPPCRPVTPASTADSTDVYTGFYFIAWC